MKNSFSVIILDDHLMMQEGLSSYLESYGCTIIARLASLSELAALLKSSMPIPDGTIAIIDKQLGAESGCDAISMINAAGRGIKCIMYSAFYSVPSVMQALERGAFGYITKDTDGKELLSALETVSHGKQYVQKELQEKMNSVSVLLSLLSKKEQQVVICLLNGLDNAQIGAQLNISKRTVENHLSTIYDKLGITSKRELMQAFGGNNDATNISIQVFDKKQYTGGGIKGESYLFFYISRHSVQNTADFRKPLRYSELRTSFDSRVFSNSAFS